MLGRQLVLYRRAGRDNKRLKAMYQQDITRKHRTAIVVAIDQSSSMSLLFGHGATRQSKADLVARITNELISELLLRSRYDGGVRDYYDIAVVGYSDNKVYSLLGDHLDFKPVSSLDKRDVDTKMVVERCVMLDGREVSVYREYPEWVKARACGSTPMYQMLCKVSDMLERWCAQPCNRDSFPPILVNISDGVPDGITENLLSISRHIKSLGTNDGTVLFVNVHISSSEDTSSLVMPNMSEIDIANREAMLFARMSSVLPVSMERGAEAIRCTFANSPYIAMGYNTSPVELNSMLRIGTRSVGVE